MFIGLGELRSTFETGMVSTFPMSHSGGYWHLKENMVVLGRKKLRNGGRAYYTPLLQIGYLCF